MNRDFVSLKINFANSEPKLQAKALCQLGVAVYQQGQLKQRFSSLVQPSLSQAQWQDNNLEACGISAEQLEEAVPFEFLREQLHAFLDGHCLVHHSGVEQSVLTKLMQQGGSAFSSETRWIDSLSLASQVLVDGAQVSELPLEQLCWHFGIAWAGESAQAKAEATGSLFAELCSFTGQGVEHWGKQKHKPKTAKRFPGSARFGKLAPKEEGGLLVCVSSYPDAMKKQLYERCVAEGFGWSDNLVKSTSVLIIPQAKHGSGKHKKATQWIEQGVPMKVMEAEAFLAEYAG